MNHAIPDGGGTQRYDVLTIDDSPEVIDQVRGSLDEEFRVLAAIDGEKGLQIARQRQPHLILLDVMMPGMDGFEVCRQLKADPRTRDIPVMFVTGLDSHGDEVRGFDLGAVDFISKPIEPVVLRARVRTQTELAVTRSALSAANERLANERELIAETITSMRKVYRFCEDNLSYVSRSGGEASGDLVFSACRPSGEQHVLVGDFTGHGLPAAIGTPLVSHLFYSLTESDRPMPEILAAINDVLVRQLPVHIFMVAVGLSIPAAGGPLRVWSFGAPDVLRRDTEGNWRHLGSQETPMGIVLQSGEYASREIPLGEGESMFVMSDGPIETAIDGGELFGVTRLIDSLERHALQIPPVIDEIAAQASPDYTLDDTTLLKVERAGSDHRDNSHD